MINLCACLDRTTASIPGRVCRVVRSCGVVPGFAIRVPTGNAGIRQAHMTEQLIMCSLLSRASRPSTVSAVTRFVVRGCRRLGRSTSGDKASLFR